MNNLVERLFSFNRLFAQYRLKMEKQIKLISDESANLPIYYNNIYGTFSLTDSDVETETNLDISANVNGNPENLSVGRNESEVPNLNTSDDVNSETNSIINGNMNNNIENYTIFLNNTEPESSACEMYNSISDDMCIETTADSLNSNANVINNMIANNVISSNNNTVAPAYIPYPVYTSYFFDGYNINYVQQNSVFDFTPTFNNSNLTVQTVNHTNSVQPFVYYTNTPAMYYSNVPAVYYSNVPVMYYSNVVQQPMVNYANTTQPAVYVTNISHPTVSSPNFTEFTVYPSNTVEPTSSYISGITNTVSHQIHDQSSIQFTLNAMPTSNYTNTVGPSIYDQSTAYSTLNAMPSFSCPNGITNTVSHPIYDQSTAHSTLNALNTISSNDAELSTENSLALSIPSDDHNNASISQFEITGSETNELSGFSSPHSGINPTDSEHNEVMN